MKKYLFLSPLAALFAVSCTDNEFLGTEEAQHTVNGEVAINFESGAAALTRAGDITGAPAAALLNENYVVMGVKGDGSSQQKVFDHYNINYFAGTANSTETNVKDWEYVGQAAHANSAVTIPQVIKYWDYATSQYDFVAFSYGGSTKPADVVAPATGPDLTLSSINCAYLGQPTTGTPVYTITGTPAVLAKAYVADLVTVYKADYQSTVTPRFRQLGTKVRIAIYETVPGYSVKDVKFYAQKSRSTAATTTPTLFTTDNVDKLPAGTDVATQTGVMKVYFPTVGADKAPGGSAPDTDYNKAHVVYASDPANSGADLSDKMTFASLNYSAAEFSETAGNIYLGRSSSTATYATATDKDGAYQLVLPYGEGNDLNLHVDYTLVSVDGSGEEINVKSATALVPAIYTNWQPNYAYTYLFKISKNTNGTTGDPGDPDNPGNPGSDPSDPTPDPSGLYPITFDAVVMDFGDGIQETITTVSKPSVTTYAKGVEPTATSEYPTNKNIYICLENPGSATLTTTNSKLYTVTLEAGALQKIDEGSVANVLTKGVNYVYTPVTSGTTLASGTTYYNASHVAVPGDDTTVAGDGNYFTRSTVSDGSGSEWVVIDAAYKAMTVTASALSIVTEIAAADATDGNAVAGNFAVFKPTTAGTYAFEYTDAADKKHYKIIIVH